MARGIRAANAQDATAVGEFFQAVNEMRHGASSPRDGDMQERTRALLFPDGGDKPAVFLFESEDGAIQGVAAVREPDAAGAAELITVHVYDTVQGKGIAQTLLRTAVEHIRARGAILLHTEVEQDDVRARGFLRREGFVAAVPEGDQGAAAHGGRVRYVMVWPGSARS